MHAEKMTSHIKKTGFQSASIDVYASVFALSQTLDRDHHLTQRALKRAERDMPRQARTKPEAT